MTGGTLTLPTPPSQNDCWRNAGGRRGRVRTLRYLTWLRAAGNQAMAQPRWHVEGPYVVDITIEKKAGDIDNLIKPTVDALVSWEYVPDDRHMVEVRARWGRIEGCIVRAWPVLWDTSTRNNERANPVPVPPSIAPVG